MGKTHKFSPEEETCDNCGKPSTLRPTRGGRYCPKCYGYRMEYTKQVERVWREDDHLK